MKEFIIKNKKGKVLAKVFCYLENFRKGDKEEIIKSLINKVKSDTPNKSRYAGYKTDKELREFLKWAIFGQEQGKEFSFRINRKDDQEIQSICKKTIELCKDFIEKKVSISIFPTFDKFVISKMSGCCGFSPAKNIILININFAPMWKTALKQTLGHELAHAVSPYYNGGNYALGEGFVLDGIAEHFRESIIGGKRSPWARAIIKKEAIRILTKLKDKLESKDELLWREVFFGGGKYPHWAGYSIGYYLVKDYLKKQRKTEWKKIITTPPKDILKEIISDWKIG